MILSIDLSLAIAEVIALCINTLLGSARTTQFSSSAPTITPGTWLVTVLILVSPCGLTDRMIELHSHLVLDALLFCLDSLILENSTVLRNKHRLWSHLSARRLWRNHLPFLSSSFHISQSGNNPHLIQSL